MKFSNIKQSMARKRNGRFGGGSDEIGALSEKSLNRKCGILISRARKILQEEVGLSDLWFRNNYWEGRQWKIAPAMVKDRSPEFWLEVLRWCLRNESDPFARKVRNLKPLINYQNYYLEEKRLEKERKSTKVEIKEKIKKWR